MSTVLPATVLPATVHRSPVSLALRAELSKLTTLRSQWATPLLSVLLTVGVTYGTTAALGRAEPNFVRDPSVGVFYGLNFGQVALVCFGILLIGQEYHSGTIRGSLTAVPRRGLLYGAKLGLGALVGLAVGVLGTAGAFLSYQSTIGLDRDTPGLARSAVAGVLYPPLLVVLCLGLTTVLRNLTAAMGLLTPAVFLGSPLLSGVPVVRELVQFLPDRAGTYALRNLDDPHIHYGHWTGLALMAAWSAAAAYGGWRSLRRQDV
ncbi:ABC transporter permease [Kitasatospora sp. HPMI-4]|uniref:ABC transporter permease n=1 Tax=Kitasatospora sp. HPMI-4 TaxID=3448443 RepID=UPI003F1C2BEE